MAAVSEIDETSPETICAWLNDGTTPERVSTETVRPWAQTFRIEGESADRFLKVLPKIQSAALPAMPLLAELFPHVVPAVRSIDPARGLLVLDHHGGVDLDRDAPLEQRQAMLVTYAKLQAEAVEHDELLERLPQIALDKLVPNLLRFLNPKRKGAASFGPARGMDFFDEERCRYYFELFQARAEALNKLILSAAALPTTVNHCDLRPSNAAVRAGGAIVLYDWDEAVAGPAGMSLHNFFSGCSTPVEMLRDPASALSDERAEARTLLGAYLNTLAAHGYAGVRRLTKSLPGAVCAGVIHYLLSYARFVPDDKEYAEDVGEILRRRLNDLLVLADLLCATSRKTTDRIVRDYERRQRPDHACRVLVRHVERNPDDVEAVEHLGKLLVREETRDSAAEILERLLNRHPESGAIRRLYGLWRLEQLDFDAAIYHLTQAVQLGETDDALAAALDEATEYRDAVRHAKQPGCMPTVRVSAEEQAAGALKPLRRRLAVALFREYGTLLIENAFAKSLVEQMHAEYLERYRRYFVNAQHEDALRVGNKRFMVTVALEGAFHSPDVYANPHVAPIIQDVLGGKMIMGGFVSVCSLPGAEAMRIHKDHPALFPEVDDPDQFPHFAVTAVVPMRGFNQELGTTRVMKRSHRFASKIADEMETQDPSAPVGSVLLMDYRLTHQGRANRGTEVRPILTMIYHRPWFRDIVNYGQQNPIELSDEAYARIPEEHRPLFAWTRPVKIDSPAKG